MKPNNYFKNSIAIALLVSLFGSLTHAAEFKIELSKGSFLSYFSDKKSISVEELAYFVRNRLRLPSYEEVYFSKKGSNIWNESTISSEKGPILVKIPSLDDPDYNSNVIQDLRYKQVELEQALQKAQKDKEKAEYDCAKATLLSERWKEKCEIARSDRDQEQRNCQEARDAARVAREEKEKAIDEAVKAESDVENMRQWVSSLEKKNEEMKNELLAAREEISRRNQERANEQKAQAKRGARAINELSKKFDSAICSLKSLDCDVPLRSRNAQLAYDLCETSGTESSFLSFEPGECNHSGCTKRDYCTFSDLPPVLVQKTLEKLRVFFA